MNGNVIYKNFKSSRPFGSFDHTIYHTQNRAFPLGIRCNVQNFTTFGRNYCYFCSCIDNCFHKSTATFYRSKNKIGTVKRGHYKSDCGGLSPLYHRFYFFPFVPEVPASGSVLGEGWNGGFNLLSPSRGVLLRQERAIWPALPQILQIGRPSMVRLFLSG